LYDFHGREEASTTQAEAWNGARSQRRARKNHEEFVTDLMGKIWK